MNFRKSKPFLFITLLIYGILTSCNPKKELTLSEILQTKLDSVTKLQLVPGITLSLRLNDSMNISLSSGLSDIEDSIAMKPDDVMFSGSVGKTYVSALILKLYEQGKIDLKAKAIDYLKDEKWFGNIPNAKDFTIEMLMNHTAGVPEYVYFPQIWDSIKQNPEKIWTVEERLSVIFNQPPVNVAGEAWNYADSHYIILGLIIEKTTGKTYYRVLDEYILKPYNLSKTIPSDKTHLTGLISGYTALSVAFKLPEKVLNSGRYCFNPQLEWTGGGLISTVSDLTLWAKQLYGGDVLKPETQMLLFTPAKPETDLFENAKYGLGCFIGETNGVKYYGHTGFVPGYITMVQYVPIKTIF